MAEADQDLEPSVSARIRRRTFEVLELGAFGDRLSKLIDWFLILLIIGNVLAVAIETVEGMDEAYGPYFHGFEIFSVFIFSAEYFARVWIAAESRLEGDTTLAARLRWMRSPFAIIDLLSILPFFLSMFFAADLRVLRVFRLLRLFKLARYSPALAALGKVFVDERRALAGTLVIMLGLVVVSATILHFAERGVQPDAFGDIPKAMWWAIVTLTTVGYGDVVPVTLFGRVVAAAVMLFGLAIYAIPIGIIGFGFSNEIHKREFMIRWGLIARVPLFQGLSADLINEISQRLRALVATPSQTLIRRGETIEEMYFIASGRVAIRYASHEVVLTEGEFFGEAALLEPIQGKFTAVAETKCRLMVLEGHDLKHLLLERADLRFRVANMAISRIADLVAAGELTMEEGEAAERLMRAAAAPSDDDGRQY